VKLFVFTPAGTAGYFESLGLPGALGYLTMLAEIAGGLALILGVKTRLVSAALVPVLLGAAYFGHAGAGFNWSNPNGGWEYPVMWAVVQAAIAALGDGAYALLPASKSTGRAQYA
jgi:putative oxidoreductase